VAEVALRRRDSGLWGNSTCKVVTARKQFAPSLVPPAPSCATTTAWAEAIALPSTPSATGRCRGPAQGNRARCQPLRRARHCQPTLEQPPLVATIGDHTFYRVQKLTPRG
jgi:hypothetical protein